MHLFSRYCLNFTIGLLAVSKISAQVVDQSDFPERHEATQAPSKKELDQREAMHLFAQGVVCEREDRLLEATRFYENAAKLDPEAVTILKSLVMSYIAVERHEDAAALLEKVVKQKPRDHEMSYIYARLLRHRGMLTEACEVLRQGLQSEALRARPDLHQQMEFDLGVLYERLEQFETAAAAFGRAAVVLEESDGLLEMRNGSEPMQMRAAEIYERIGRNFLDARNFDKAAAAFRKAQSKFPQSAGRLQYYLTQVSLRQGKLDEAAASLQEYLKLFPQGTDAYELMIALMQKQKRDTEILSWLEQASDQDSFNVGLRILLARQCARAGQIAKAEKIYRELAEKGPSEQIYRDLFLIYMDHHHRGAELVGDIVNETLQAAASKDNPLANNPAPAQSRAMVAALRENPGLAREVLRATAKTVGSKPFHIDALQLFAVIADRLDLLAEAEIYYRECIKQPLPAATEPLIYSGLTRVLWKTRHYEALLDVCRTGLKQTQACNHIVLRADLTLALAALQRWDEALSEADQAVCDAKDGERFRLRQLRIRVLTQADKIGQAEKECQDLLKELVLPGELLEVHYLLANIYSVSKRVPKAESELLECLKIDANHVVANNDLGYSWADNNKNLAEAEAMIRKAIEQDRKNRQGLLSMPADGEKEFHDNACYIDSLGWVLFRRGQLEVARKELEYAATLPDSDDPVIWDHLGDVRLALGQREEALAAWQKALHYYDEGKRRKMDERYQALVEKVKAVGGTK